MSDWTRFDPNLRIDEYADETSYLVVVTYLPTGVQESCGRHPHQSANRAEAIARLKMKVVGGGV